MFYISDISVLCPGRMLEESDLFDNFVVDAWNSDCLTELIEECGEE